MAEFDIVSKQLFKDYPADFVRFVLGREGIQILEVIDTELPTVESRETDTLARVRIGDEEALVHTEFQTGDSTRTPMPRRMAGYIGRQIERFGLPIYSNVIYLRPDAGRRDPGRYEQDRVGFRVVIEYNVIRLIEVSGKQIIDQKLWGLLPFAPLMQPPEGTPSENWLRHCVQTADELALERMSKSDFLTDLAILSGLVYDSQTIFNIISEEIMYESSVVQHFAERGIRQGLQQGRTLSILVLIGKRFSRNDADTIKPTLESIQDFALLEQIFDKAIDAETFNEFQQALNALIS